MSAEPLRVRCFEGVPELTAALIERLEEALTRPRAGESAVMLSGGSTPMPAYRALARRGPRPTASTVLFYSDERYVPSSSEASNYHQTESLVAALALPTERLLRVRTELPLEDAAADYERSLRALAAGGIRIGLGLLGLGADGHTASLFNAEDLARAHGHAAIAVHRPDGRDAVSVTPSVFEQAREIVFVVDGESKRSALARLVARDASLTAWQAVRGCTSVSVWTEPQAWPGT